jgi:type II secretion system protein H
MTRRSLPYGFTLLELLIVLAIVALVCALAIAGFSAAQPTRKLDAEAERLKQVMDLMCEQAESDARVLGLSLARNLYAVMQPPVPVTLAEQADAQPKPWKQLPNRPSFATRTLPAGMRLALRLGSSQRAVDLGEKLPDQPQIVCAGNLELGEFELQIILGKDENEIRRRIIATAPSIEQISSFATALLPEAGQ